MTDRSGNNHIRAVIFDLGRVLVNVDLQGGMYRYYFNSRQLGDQEILDRIFNNEIFIAFNTGRLKPHDFHQLLITNYQLNLPYDQFVQEWCAMLAPMEGMAGLVTELSARYTLGILSDTDPLHWPYCQKQFPFLKLFTRPTLSYQTGFLKPDPRCYELAARNTATTAEFCLFIDDRENNVSGARKAGMTALRFSGLESLRRELTDMHIL